MNVASWAGIRAVFRCDASPTIGFGHVARCLTVAQGLREASVSDIRFVTHDIDSAVTSCIRVTGFNVILLSGRIGDAEDLAITKATCTNGHSLLFTDSHELNEGYYVELHQAGIPIVSFDDYAGVPYASDVVINHNITADKFAYQVASYTKLLLGTKYVPLREPFRRFKGQLRSIREPVESVVVCLGGMPEPHAASAILDGLRQWASDGSVRVTMIMGMQATHGMVSAIEQLLPPLGKVVVDPQDLASLLWEADFAIVNGSVTAYEAAALGTPLVMTAVADNQTDAVAGFGEKGIAVTLPAANDLSPEAVTSAVVTLAGDVGRRMELVAAGRGLVDGRGIQRIVDVAAGLVTGEPSHLGKGDIWVKS